MDAGARLALEDLVRQAVGRDLDELLARMTVVERLVGMAREPDGAAERRAAAVAMRRRGFSINAIAGALGAHPNTIANDLRALGEPAPPAVRGLDGRRTRPHHRAAG